METLLPSVPTILVTGAGGQLGKELQKLATENTSYRFLFTTRENLPIDDPDKIKRFFDELQVDYCINCAAYTAVDRAEVETGAAYLINATAVANLARVCLDHQTALIHISTDYVFNGQSTRPYKEDDAIAPLNIYGASKLKGEELAFDNHPHAVVIRTSWVYSSFGNNFVKTMVRLLKEKTCINVVNDQYGCPTYAADIAAVIMQIVDQSKTSPIHGIFNYCNDGVATWYEFALAIKEIIRSGCIVHPIPSSDYKTPATRPQYSVLDTSKIKSLLNINIPHWRHSLERCLLS